MTEPAVGHRPGPSAIEVVPQAIADEVVAEVTATIVELERELEELRQAASGAAEPVDDATQLLLGHAEALVSEAQAHRAHVIDASWTEAATILDAIPATPHDHR